MLREMESVMVFGMTSQRTETNHINRSAMEFLYDYQRRILPNGQRKKLKLTAVRQQFRLSQNIQNRWFVLIPFIQTAVKRLVFAFRLTQHHSMQLRFFQFSAQV